MTVRVAQLWRHPIKSHGREQIPTVALTENRAMPWDRRWAVAHDRARLDKTKPGWSPCQNFSRTARAPGLQAIWARVDAEHGTVTLGHPDREEITIDPDREDDARALVAWVRPISEGSGLSPSEVIRVPDVAMTDTDFPSVSLINLASHAAVETQAGAALSPLRWRGNILLEGLEPWAEMHWPGKRLRAGEAELEIVEPIVRCRATEANPVTGRRDIDTLRALREGWGHQNCGIYARVTRSGRLSEGDTVEVLD